MVSVEDVDREIMELERRDASYSVVERLCWLYVVRDHLRADAGERTEERTGDLGGSDFLVAASMVPLGDLMAVLDEHMESIRVSCPQEYESVIARIRALR